MNPTQSTRFEVIKQHGHHYLRLSLPEGSPVLDDICCNDDYDYEVPDAVIDINLDKLISALEIMMLNQDVFRHVGIEAGVESEGYEGKLRQEYLKLYANRVINNWHFSFFLEFCNEGTGSVYFIDLTIFFSNTLGTFDNIVDALKQLIPSSAV